MVYGDMSKSCRMWLPGSKRVRIALDVRFVESLPKRVAVLKSVDNGSSEHAEVCLLGSQASTSAPKVEAK